MKDSDDLPPSDVNTTIFDGDFGCGLMHGDLRWKMAIKTGPGPKRWKLFSVPAGVTSNTFGGWPAKLAEPAKIGDEIWWYATDDASWKHLAGRAGWALVRTGRVIEITIELLN